MTTLKEITDNYNAEDVCIPAKFSKPAKVRGHDVTLCLYNNNAYCPYRHDRPELSYCLLGKEGKDEDSIVVN